MRESGESRIGADLFPALVALMQWGDRWLDDRGGPVELRHRDCGEPVEVQLRCAAGHEVDVSALDAVRRSGAPDAVRRSGGHGRRG
jgi:hypothetical protein